MTTRLLATFAIGTAILLSSSTHLKAEVVIKLGSVGNADFETPNVRNANLQFSTGLVPGWTIWEGRATSQANSGIHDTGFIPSQTAFIEPGGAISSLSDYRLQVGDRIKYGYTDVAGVRADPTMHLVYQGFTTAFLLSIPGSQFSMANNASSGTGIVGLAPEFVVTAGSPWVNSRVGVGFTNSGGTFAEIDDVVLIINENVTAIPEPSSLGLFAIAGLGLPIWRRIKSRKMASASA